MFHIYPRANGCVASVLSLPRTLWYVYHHPKYQMFFWLSLISCVKSCFLCPNEGGAFKQTVQGEWVHLLCAIWIPETRVANDVFMEPITGADRISKQRWKLVSVTGFRHKHFLMRNFFKRCNVCDIREGACIQCTKPSCFVAYHATCARKEKLLMPMKSAQGAEPASLMCFCDRHLPVRPILAL